METHFEAMERSHNEVARDRVMEDLRTLARDAEHLLQATAGDVSEKAKEARTRLVAAVNRARANCDELEQKAIDRAKAAARKADTVIRDHPYESIGIAFGVGLLIGVLVARK